MIYFLSIHSFLEFLIPILTFSWFIILVFRIISYYKLDQLINKTKLVSNPKISIIIPARNERLNIERCLKSLQQQKYNNFEVIVVDDCSSDNTYELAQRFCQTDHRFSVVRLTKDISDGWVGKNLACHEGYKKSNGDVLLFIDADTEHHNDSLFASLSYMQKNNLDVLTMFPKLICTDFWGKVTLPIIVFMINILYSPLLLNSKNTSVSYLIGGFILIKKDVYKKIGGHESVKESFVEDKSLGTIIKKSGFKLRLIRANDFVRTFSNIGYLNNINAMQRVISASFIEMHLFFGLAAILLAFLGLILPYLLLFRIYSFEFIDVLYIILIISFMKLSYLIEFSDIYHSKLYVFLYPFTIVIFFYVLIISVFKVNSNSSFVWRDRSYNKIKL